MSGGSYRSRNARTQYEQSLAAGFFDPERGEEPFTIRSIGFSPYLSGRGRLVVKDAIMLGAAMLTMGDSARAHLERIGPAASPAMSRE